MTIYFFPGQGADRRIFQFLSLPPVYKIKIIEYGTPAKGINMAGFARHLSSQINTREEFILVGVSLGGMICVELAEMLHPKKTIIISSCRNRNELPFLYKLQKWIPVYQLLPAGLLLAGAKFLQPLVEPDRNKHKEIFKGMLAGKDARYMKRTINLIVNWNRTFNSKPVIQVHGDHDHTLPHSNLLNPDHIVKKGSHMMTLTRAEEINDLLIRILSND